MDARRPDAPHWYSPDRFTDLVTAYLAQERAGGPARTIRDFIAEFRGLSGTRKQKAITDETRLTGKWLHDLSAGDEVDRATLHWLHAVMRQHSRPVKPRALGTIGAQHFTNQLVSHWGIDRASVRYRKAVGEHDGLPFVWKVAFGVYRPEYEGCDQQILVGLNWTPTISLPIRELGSLLGNQRLDWHDPVVLVLHLACPVMTYTDRGKSVLYLNHALQDALTTVLIELTKEWKQGKRQADREDRMAQQTLERMRRERRRQMLSIKDAAYEVMTQAYLLASANNTLPANARQVMYAARPSVLALTGGRIWKDSSYFTQHLLPDNVKDHPTQTAEWDVVFDARGHFVEPHGRMRTDLGTIEVRHYLSRWACDIREDIGLDPSLKNLVSVPTFGPANRYNTVLFIEKEGFTQLLDRAGIAERFDLAIMSTKGMSVTAARTLVERLSDQGVTILVVRDFDKAGFSIVHTLRSDTRRYQFGRTPRVIDLGLRLSDVEAMGLQSEPVTYDGKVDPRENLRESGATETECDFLVKPKTAWAGWRGERVELNAMTSDHFIAWLETKLTEAGITKVIPDSTTLAKAYRRAARISRVSQAITQVLADLVEPEASEIEVPEDLTERIRAAITGTSRSWDQVLWDLVKDDEDAA